MKRNVLTASLLLGVVFVGTLSPFIYRGNSIALNTVSAAATCANKAQYVGQQATGYNAIDPKLLREPPPQDTAYACALFGGGGYAYFDANDTFLGKTLGGPLQNKYTCDANNNCKPKSVDCSTTWDKMTNPGTCLMRSALSWLGTGLIWLGVTLATIAAGIFEATLKYTIIELGKYLGLIKSGIDVGWTALRDIANIIIIGLFVFIAVNIILGVKDFGDKKKVARVLIVAVLINFSLLFTKVIVDASNFTAYQFYNQMVRGIDQNSKNNLNQTAQVIPGTESSKQAALTGSGIAGKFMKLLGVEGVAGTDQKKLGEIAENNKDALTALGYGFLSFIFLTAVAFVLLYGAFLMISRAVLIIFLMLTSAVAFASWLIPQQYVQGGFAKWWESLLKAAFFAPILMALLWITVVVSESFEKAFGGKGVLGSLATDPSNPAHILALLSFVFILGLLFAAFATASSFSKTISGFRFAQAGVGGALFTSLGGASRLLGLAGRGSIGALSASTFRWMRDNRLASGPDSTWGTRMQARAYRWMGQRTFDPMAVKSARGLTQRLGGMMLGGDEIGKGGFIGVKQRQAKAAEELARAMRPSEASRDALATAARASEQAAINAQHGALTRGEAAHVDPGGRGAERAGAEEENRVRDTQQAERAARSTAQATVEAARQQITTEEDRQRTMEESYANEIQSTQQSRIDAAQKAARVAELEEERSSARAGFERIISQRTQDLQAHEAALEPLNRRVEQLDRQASRAGEDMTHATEQYAQAHLDNIERDRRALDRETPERLRGAEQQARAPYEVRALAEQIVSNKITPFRQAIRAELGGAIEQHNLEQAVAAFARAQRAAQGPPAPAPAPVVPPAGP